LWKSQVPSGCSFSDLLRLARGARNAARLASKGDQHGDGGTKDKGVNTKIEEKSRRHRNGAKKRQINVLESRSEERAPKQCRGNPCASGRKQPKADPAHRQHGETRLHPTGAAGHVLKNEGDRERQPGDETATRQI